MSVGVIFTEIDLDMSKFVAKQKKLLSDIKKVGEDSEKGLQQSFTNLGVTADSIYQLMANKAIASYNRITNAGQSSAAEQIRAHESMVAKINAINTSLSKSSAYESLGIRSSQAIATEMRNTFRWYELAKQQAAGNANELVRIEAAKNAKIIALENELGAVRTANREKALAEAKATADATRALEEKKAAEIMRWMTIEREAYAANQAFNLKLHNERIALLKQEAAERLSLSKSAAQSNSSDWSLLGAGRSTSAIKEERAAVEAAYLRQKELAAGNSRDLVAIEEAKNAKMLALNKEYHASVLANKAKERAIAQDTANAQIAAQQKAVEVANAPWQSLGVRSTSSIIAQKKEVESAFKSITANVQKGSDEWVRIERAKNDKLKELNKELTGDHEMNMASMTRAVLRAYAAFYVLSTAGQAFGSLFMGGVKAIDDLKINTIAVASTLTSMQGTTGNIVENYRQNLVYADALNKKLMEVDANSFANYEQLQLMNRAMNTQGVVLDSNNKKQVEAFTAISNTIALLTTGQNKEMQASQEMNALMTGRIKATDRVAMMIDGIIKQEGKYKGGLEEVVKLGKEHGDTLQRLEPYLRGITVASGDIGSTWAAVTSSLETAWGIIQRGLFKDIYKSITKDGRDFTQWMKDNADDIVAKIRGIYEAIEFTVKAGIPIFGLWLAGVLYSTTTAGAAATRFAAIWEAMTARITTATSKMTMAFNIFTGLLVGWETGQILNKFETIRKFGVTMAYDIIDAWEYWTTQVRVGLESSGAAYAMQGDPNNANKIRIESEARIAALTEAHDREREKRDQWRREQQQENTDDAIAKKAAIDRLMSFATGNYTPTINGKSAGDDPEKALSTARNKLQEVRNEIREAYEDAISKTKQWAAEMRSTGANEFDVIANIYMRRNEAIDEAYNREKTAIQNSIMLADEKGKVLSKLDRENTQRKNQADEEFLKGSISYYDRQVSIVSDAYNAIGDYSEASMKAQIAHIEETYIERLRYVQEGSEKEIVILKALEEEKFKIRNEAQKKLIDMQLSYLKDIGKGSSKEAYELEKEKIKNEADMLERQFKNAGGMSEEAVKKLSGEKQYTDQLREEYQQRLLDRAEYLRGMGEKDAAKEAEESAKALAERKIELQNKVTENAIKGLAVQFDKAKWLDEQMRELDSKYFTQKADLAAASLGSMSDALQSIGSMYAEGSDEQKRFFEMAKAFALAQTVIETSKAVVLGVEAVISAMAAGDGYTAVARGAAVAAAVAACLAQIGVAFNGPSGGASSSSASTTPAMGNSTVLGAEYGAGSESISKSLELLQDTYDLEDTKLTKIYNELKDLNGNITGLVTAYIRTGGNMTADDFGVALGSTMGGMQVGSENFRNWMEKGGFFNMGAWFDSEDSITQFIQAFHQADIVGTWINKEIGRIIGDLFGGGQEVWSTGTGIALGRSTVGGLMSGAGAGARGYADITKRTSTEPWRADSYDYETLYRDLDSSVTRMFDQVYQGLGATLLELAKQFGTDTQAALDYSFAEAKINLADMTGEEMNKALQEYISKIGDEAAEALFGGIIGKYQQLNEGMLETATRLVMDKNIVESMLGLTNQGLRAEAVAVMKSREVLNDEWVKWNEKQGASKYISMMVDVIAEPSKYLTETYVEMELGTSRVIEFTESLIEMAGGLEKLTDAFNTYYDSFFSDKEKQQDLKMQLQGALGGYGYNLPGTRSGYRAIVEGLDINTSSGLEAYNTLLQLSKSADAYYDYIEQSRGGMRETDYASRADYMRAMRGYADGGMSYGPESGYMAMLHGPELIVSPKKGYPATVVGGSDSPELLAEIKGLRADMRERSYRSQELMRRLNLTIENWDGNGIPAERAA